MSYFSGGWKTKFKSLAGLVSGESLFPGSQMAVFALGGRASWFPDGRLLSESENFLVPRWPSSLSVGELPGSQMAIFSLGGRASWFPDGRLLSGWDSFLVPRWPSSL